MLCACFFASEECNADNTNHIENWGRLRLSGNQLSDQDGDPIQLKGVTAFSPDYENCLKTREDLFNLREMGVNCVRIARLISGEDIISDEQVKQWMEWTYEAGLYCIIDWNFMNKFNTKNINNGNPNDYIEEAAKFFHTVAQEVADKQYQHILYEICNEPGAVNWTKIKSYSEAIIDTITKIDTKKPIIIVGTPNWCQNINSQVAQSGNLIVTNKAEIIYAFHFYAGESTHMGLENSEFLLATAKIPVIVTEWSLGRLPENTTAENNKINTEGGTQFLNHCQGSNGGQQLVSWIYYSYGSGGNGGALYKDECGEELKEVGSLISNVLSINTTTTTKTEQYYNVKNWGRLRLSGNQLSDKNGNPIQLKGFTAFSPDYENCLKSKEDLVNLREMGVNCVRIARLISGEDIISDEQVKQWMEWTYEAGLYCIIDWNFMNKFNTKNINNGNPNDYIEEAAKFFHTVAQEVADKQYQHILYEICNEPGAVNWTKIKSYSEAIIDTITKIDTKKPIIIVGTPNWCQNINSQVAQSGNLIVTNKAEIIYAFHFYAGESTHMGLENSEFLLATAKIPVIVTEWSLGRLPENTTAENNKINTEGGTQFLNHCLGSDGSRQIVSWIYYSYGSGGNGGAMYKDECGGELTIAGNQIDISFRGTCCTEPEQYYHVKNWGRLQLVDNQLSDKKGKPVQLKGFTAFSPDYVNCLKSKEDLVYLRDMGVNCVRIARLISGENIISDEQVKQWMEWTYETGLYCIIDWHFMDRFNGKKTDSGDPNDYIEEAAKFFHMVAQEVADKQYKHILYEVCNEPSNVTSATIKSYAETIIDTITKIDTEKPIIIVGTPNWCQKPYTQGNDKITTEKAGVMYAFHFYAGENDHLAIESTEFLHATKTLPVFATEWNLGKVPENTTAENNTINTNGGNMFMNHCQGTNGSQQLVSWMYNAYGYGGNGAALFKDGCGEEMTEAGQHIDMIFRGTCCTPNPIQSHIFHFTKDEELTMNLGFYNENPLKQEGEWASGSGICYYDANISGVGEIHDGNYKETEMVTSLINDEEYEALICQAGRQWTTFRVDECVDVAPAFIEGSWNSGLYSINCIDAGEWILYTIDVETPGYYSMQMAVNNLVFKSMKYPEFRLSLTDYPKENIMVDIDKSTNTEEVLLESSGNCTGFIPYTKISVSEAQLENDEDMVWCYTGDTLESANKNVKTNYGLLFKETGQYTLKLFFPTRYHALGGLKFNYSKPWSGEGYNEGTGIVTTQEATISLYPTIVEEGHFTVSTPGKATVSIYNVTGTLLQTEEIDRTSEISTKLASGVYNVQIVCEGYTDVAKIIIK